METTTATPQTTDTSAATEQVPATTTTPVVVAAKKEEIVKEEYKDHGEYVAEITQVTVDKKVQPTASYGHRIRIAKLFESHEEFMYKIITVAGWAKSVRANGKEFCFIEVNDGSSLKGIQVSILTRKYGIRIHLYEISY